MFFNLREFIALWLTCIAFDIAPEGYTKTLLAELLIELNGDVK